MHDYKACRVGLLKTELPLRNKWVVSLVYSVALGRKDLKSRSSCLSFPSTVLGLQVCIATLSLCCVYTKRERERENNVQLPQRGRKRSIFYNIIKPERALSSYRYDNS